MWQRIWSEFDRWARGRMWGYRVPLLVLMVYFSVQMHVNQSCGSWLSPINFVVHEMGHLVFRFFGQLLHAAGGTLLQCAVPVISVIILIRVPDYFGIPFCGHWLASNLYEVSVYMSDARAQELPLLSVEGPEAEHDWVYLLGQFGMLHWDRTFGWMIAGVGFVLEIASVVLCVYLLYRMWNANRNNDQGPGQSASKPKKPVKKQSAKRPKMRPLEELEDEGD